MAGEGGGEKGGEGGGGGKGADTNSMFGKGEGESGGYSPEAGGTAPPPSYEPEPISFTPPGGEPPGGESGGFEFTPPADLGEYPSLPPIGEPGGGYDPGGGGIEYPGPGSEGGFEIAGGGFDGGALPPGATMATGPQPDWNAIGGAAAPPAPAFSWESLNYVAPAGTGSTPDIEALNTAPLNTSPLSSIETPTAGAGVSGMSAAGGEMAVMNGGGGADLTTTGEFVEDPTKTGTTPGSTTKTATGGGGEENWLTKSFKATNPVQTALAAGGLGLNIWKNQQQQEALKKLGGGNTAQENATKLATEAMNKGNELSKTGANLVIEGAGNLNKAAEVNAGTSADLIGQGQKNVQSGVTGLQGLAVDPTKTATALQTKGTDLTKYVGTGTLPVELQQQLDTEKADARTAIISRHATKGMPTNPKFNSTLRQELIDLDRRSVIAANDMAAKLATTGNTIAGTGLNATQVAGGLQGNVATAGAGQTGAGVSTAGLSGQNLATATGAGNNLAGTGAGLTGTAAGGFNNLMNMDQKQAEALQAAIAKMAAALGGQTAKV